MKGSFPIFSIMPFYDGKKESVLPVYESSYQFSGYISQAKIQLDCRGISFEHYFFVADEIIASAKRTLEAQRFYLLGRMAEWEYYNMDVAITAAMKLNSKIS